MAKNPALRLPFPGEEGGSLVECLIECADDIRQLHTDFGGRAYGVWLVWTQWTADMNGDGLVTEAETLVDDNTVGAGRQEILIELPILPVPEVSTLDGVRRDLDVTGNTERGGILVTEISAGYSEDVLRGLLPELVDPSAPGTLRDGLQFYYEIRELREAGHVNFGTAQCDIGPMGLPVRRKFVLDGVPDRDPYNFQWTISLMRADGERQRDGTPVDARRNAVEGTL